MTIVKNAELAAEQLREFRKAARLPKWEKETAGIEDEHIKLVTAFTLENQSRFDSCGNPRESIELITKVVPNLLLHQLVSVQPMSAPCGKAYHIDHYLTGEKIKIGDYELPESGLEIKTLELTAKTRKLATYLTRPVNVDETAKSLITEMDKEVLKDLWNNCGTVAYAPLWDTYTHEDVYCKIVEISGVIHRKTLHQRQLHIVVGRDFYEKHQDKLKWFLDKDTWRLHITDCWSENGLLVLSKGASWLESHYVWCPYILLGQTPMSLPGNETPKMGLLMRYDKKLVAGAKGYAKIIPTEKPK